MRNLRSKSSIAKDDAAGSRYIMGHIPLDAEALTSTTLYFSDAANVPDHSVEVRQGADFTEISIVLKEPAVVANAVYLDFGWR